MPGTTTRLVYLLRAALLEVEKTTGLPADDAAHLNLKRILVQQIADLEVKRTAEKAVVPADSPEAELSIQASDASASVLAGSPVLDAGCRPMDETA